MNAARDPQVNHQETNEPQAGIRTLAYQFRQAGAQRLDKFLVERLPEFSRSRLQALIKEGRVTVDGALAYKAGQMLETPAEVRVEIPASRPADLVPEAIPLDVLFENEHLLVINKPAGMVVHPAAGHDRGTLVHAVLAHAPEMEGIGGEQRPGVVHRLDKNTSGLILLAKDNATHRWLVNQFKDRRVHKVYLALVDGQPPTSSGRVDAPIGRDTAHRQSMAIVTPEKGREAITEYRTLEKFPAHTLLEAHPITGRTHQIRIHLDFLGCPVAGDTVYGRRKPSLPLDRHFLHAYRITLSLPNEPGPRTFEAPLPEELQRILDFLRSQNTVLRGA
jgi:23S rRNA pseudouridine1911/1915/1917 synthase